MNEGKEGGMAYCIMVGEKERTMERGIVEGKEGGMTYCKLWWERRRERWRKELIKGRRDVCTV